MATVRVSAAYESNYANRRRPPVRVSINHSAVITLASLIANRPTVFVVLLLSVALLSCSPGPIHSIHLSTICCFVALLFFCCFTIKFGICFAATHPSIAVVLFASLFCGDFEGVANKQAVENFKFNVFIAVFRFRRLEENPLNRDVFVCVCLSC